MRTDSGITDSLTYISGDNVALEPSDGAIDLVSPGDKPEFVNTAPYTKFVKDGTTFKVGSIDVKYV